MQIIVCVKQVPDRNARFEIASDGTHVQTEGMSWETNDFDRFAIEEALHLREETGGEVTVLTVGPDRAREVLNKALAMGADRAIHVDDDRIEGSDASGIARVIAATVRDREFDLLLTGVQSEDESYSQTGTLVAELLGLPQATVVVDTEPKDGAVRVKREVEGGAFVPVTLDLPAVLTIQTGINEPRYPTLPGIMKAKRKPKEKLGLDDLDLDPAEVGPGGRTTEIVELSFPPKKEGAEILEGSADEAATELVRRLRDDNVI